MTHHKTDISNKKIMASETETETECEKLVIPAKHFNAIIQSKDTMYDQCYKDGVKALTLLKVEKERKALYMEALDKEKKENASLSTLNMVLEKELKIHKANTKATPEVVKMLQKLNDSKQKYTPDDTRNLVEEEYKKNNYKNEINELRKSLGL